MSEENKIVEPLYYNGYISLDERAEIREYIKNLQQRIDKAIDVLGKYEHYTLPTEQQSLKNEEKVDNALSILKGEDKE